MDKLQPILVYKFWIALGAALILAPVGWWMGTDPVIAETIQRTSAVNSAFTNVEKEAKTVKTTPNNEWTQALTAVNGERADQITKETERLWNEQSAYMTFPAEMHDFLPDEFRGKFTPHGRNFYRNAYENERRRVQKIVEPLEPGVEGKLLFAATLPRAPNSPWENSVIPNEEEIWNAQEDIWLLSALMEAIARVNQHSRSIVDAPIREIKVIRLRGGDRADLESRMKAVPVAAATEASSAPKEMRSNRGKDDDNANAKTPLGQMMKEGSGGNSSGNRSSNAGIGFDLNQVFGATAGDTSTDISDANPRGGGDGPALRINFGNRENDDAPTSGADQAKASRYIDEPSATDNFATRGFYLQLVMDQRELPQLQAELASSPFPVQIARVHMKKYFRDGRGPDFRAPNATSASSQRSGGSNQPDEKALAANTAAALYRKAMSDPYLANVAIAGLMTLYRPPTPEASKSYAKNAVKPGASGSAHASAESKANPELENSNSADPGTTTTETTSEPQSSDSAASETKTAEATGGEAPPAANENAASPDEKSP